jgi:hypothetical protein
MLELLIYRQTSSVIFIIAAGGINPGITTTAHCVPVLWNSGQLRGME